MPAHHHRGGGALVDPRRQLDHAGGRRVARLGIGAVRAGEHGHAVARLEIGDALADGFDHAGALAAEPGGERLHRMLAAPHQDVAEIERDRGMTDTHLAFARSAKAHVLPAQHLRSAVLMETDGLHDDPSAAVIAWIGQAKKPYRAACRRDGPAA